TRPGGAGRAVRDDVPGAGPGRAPGGAGRVLLGRARGRRAAGGLGIPARALSRPRRLFPRLPPQPLGRAGDLRRNRARLRAALTGVASGTAPRRPFRKGRRESGRHRPATRPRTALLPPPLAGRPGWGRRCGTLTAPARTARRPPAPRPHGAARWPRHG